MVPGQTLLSRLGTLLAADTGTLASATLAVKVHLASATFNPSLGLLVGSFTEATFAGYAAITGTVGAQQLFTDPLTAQQTIQLAAPAGGWQWATTTAGAPPPTRFARRVSRTP